MLLGRIRRGVANFVKILTKQDIPVRFSSGSKSYNTGKEIVLSASANLDEIDSMVGLALHEASHSKYSQKVWYEFIDRNFDKATKRFTFVPDAMYDRGEQLYRNAKKDVQMIMNVLEDRRIDQLTFQAAPGYRAYYDALYDRYFFNNEALVQFLNSPMASEPYVDNYITHLINIVRDDADPNCLPEFDKIWDIVDLENITRYNSDPYYQDESLTPMYIQDALQILEIIYRNAIDHQPLTSPATMDESGEDGTPTPFSTGPTQDNINIPNLDPDIMEMLEEQRKFLMDELEKASIESVPDHHQLNTVDKAEANGVSVGSEYDHNAVSKILVYRKYDSVLACSGVFPLAATVEIPASVAAIEDGRVMSDALAHGLRIMNDASALVYNRLKDGRLDRRMIAGLGYGDVRVFEKTKTEFIKPVLVDVCIDASSSMTWDKKWTKALTLAIALAYTTAKIRSLHVRISLRAAPSTIYETGMIAIIYDSRVDHVSKIESFRYLMPQGGTPEGLCFEAMTKTVIKYVRGTRHYFVNLSDGMPEAIVTLGDGTVESYTGAKAHAHTRKQVDKMRQEGIVVLSYFMGHSSAPLEAAFTKMYGNDAKFIQPENIFQVIQTLNEMFLKGN